MYTTIVAAYYMRRDQHNGGGTYMAGEHIDDVSAAMAAQLDNDETYYNQAQAILMNAATLKWAAIHLKRAFAGDGYLIHLLRRDGYTAQQRKAIDWQKVASSMGYEELHTFQEALNRSRGHGITFGWIAQFQAGKIGDKLIYVNGPMTGIVDDFTELCALFPDLQLDQQVWRAIKSGETVKL